jgi:phytoene synthase
MQLTNILRDIREDAARGRTYLPTEDRKQFGCEIWNPSSGEPAPIGFEDLLRFESERARQYYERSSSLEELIPPDARPTLQIMTDIYRGILDRIAAHPRVVLLKRVGLSTFEKLTVVIRHRWRSEMAAIEGTG